MANHNSLRRDEQGHLFQIEIIVAMGSDLRLATKAQLSAVQSQIPHKL